MKEDKLRNIGMALKNFEKSFGKGAVGFLNSEEDYEAFNGIMPTGSLALDVALGIGGLPRGRVVELWGPESSGKTTLALGIMAEVQKSGGIVAMIDAENALNLDWAKTCGVDIDELVFSQPDYGEQGLNIVEGLLRTNSVDLIVVDSVPALVPKDVIEKGIDGNNIGNQARMFSQWLSSNINIIRKSDTVVLFINQVRSNISPYGSSERTPGGRALMFYASIRMRIRNKEQITASGSEYPLGIRSEIEVRKNKVAPPFRRAEIQILFDEGVSKVGEVIDLGEGKGILERRGAWYYYQGEQLGQGRENVRRFLMENKEMYQEILGKVREAYFGT